MNKTRDCLVENIYTEVNAMINGLTTQTNTYTGTTQKSGRSNATAKTKSTSTASKTASSAESNLSTKAKKFLDELRSVNDDFDFIIAGKDDDKRALADGSDKEFSVVLSPEEMERMANDEKYAEDKLKTIRTVVEMSKRINEQFGFAGTTDAQDGEGSSNIMSKFSAEINDDGTMTLFADLKKMSAKQKERIEDAKKQADEEKTKAKDKADNEEASIKRVRLTAKTEAELIQKISQIDWDKIPDEVPEPGSRFDMSI